MGIAGFLLVQCGKDEPTQSNTTQQYGRTVQLDPDDLPEPPAGMLYQAWVVRLEKSGTTYSAKYHPFAKFGWRGYPFKFTHPITGTDLGRIFTASPDTTNLFTQNLTAFVRADTLRQIVEKLLRGQSVTLGGAAENLTKMVGFLLSLEPANEAGPDTATPAIPFLAAYSNDSGKFEMVYPYNYRHPDFFATFFLATPTDILFNIRKETDPAHIANEHRGVWFGEIDTSRYDLGIRMTNPDTVLRKLARDLMPGWQFEGWIERNGTRVSLGRFIRGDSADLANPYALVADSAFSVPGEDFLVNPPAEFANPATGVLNSTLFITLEPKPDNDPAMFPVILFRAFTPENDSAVRVAGGAIERNLHYNYVLENRARFFPRVRVRVIPEQR